MVYVGYGAKPRAAFGKLGSRLLPNSLNAATHASAASKGMGGSFLVMVIKTVCTLVPCSRNVSAGSSSQLSASGRSRATWRGPLAQMATSLPPGRRKLNA